MSDLFFFVEVDSRKKTVKKVLLAVDKNNRLEEGIHQQAFVPLAR